MGERKIVGGREREKKISQPLSRANWQRKKNEPPSPTLLPGGTKLTTKRAGCSRSLHPLPDETNVLSGITVTDRQASGNFGRVLDHSQTRLSRRPLPSREQKGRTGVETLERGRYLRHLQGVSSSPGGIAQLQLHRSLYPSVSLQLRRRLDVVQ